MGEARRQGRDRRQLWSCFQCQSSEEVVFIGKTLRSVCFSKEAEILNDLSNDHVVQIKGLEEKSISHDAGVSLFRYLGLFDVNGHRAVERY